VAVTIRQANTGSNRPKDPQGISSVNITDNMQNSGDSHLNEHLTAITVYSRRKRTLGPQNFSRVGWQRKELKENKEL